MAANDIVPLVAPYGGQCKQSRYPMTAGATFLEGEPVLIVAAGTLEEVPVGETDATADGGLIGIAAARAVRVVQLQTGTEATPTATTRALAPVYDLTPDTEFITRNVMDASDVLIAPLAAHVGEKCSIRKTAAGDTSGINVGAAPANQHFVVTRVLDSLKRDIQLSGGAGVFAVFRRAEE